MVQPPSALLADLATHLQKVDQDPALALDTELLEQCELLTRTPEYRQQHVWQDTSPLFLQIAGLLPKLQQDPSLLVRFVTRLSEPYRFSDIKDLEFDAGLALEPTPVHPLILSLLGKAAASSNDAQALANRPSVVAAVVRLWLCTPDVGVAAQAERLLTALLEISKNEPAAVSGETPLHTYGAGPMWRRLFNDRHVKALYYHYTSLQSLPSPPLPLLSKRDKTVSQARLLGWLPKVGALDWNAIASGHELEVERAVGLTEGQGLLHYAALHMVDTDDVLMHMTLVNFFGDLIATVKTKSHLTPYDSSFSLDFLQKEGIHKRIIDLHTTDRPGLEHTILSPQTAQYISDYAAMYPENFQKSAEMVVVRDYLRRNVRKCEPHDLGILAFMPRATLVPRREGGLAWDDCVVLDVPITRASSDALRILATVFHGPLTREITFPIVENIGDDQKHVETEAVFARLLTCLYYTKHPSMFSDIVTYAETIAIKDTALAALSLLHAIITSSWSSKSLPEAMRADDPLHSRLQNFPQTGLDLVLDPTLRGSVLPLLLKPATSFSNLVGGRGDAEDAAYQVAMAKLDVLKALGGRLEKEGGRRDIVAMVRKRVSEGPWGVGGGAGSRIGTLEL